MDLLALFILISQVRFGDMLVSPTRPCHIFSTFKTQTDVLVHRQLSAAIDHAPLHASLHSKDYVERILDNVNRRHRMAQMASRASVEFYVGLALQGRGESESNKSGSVTEEAFVIRTFRNGVGVFVHR
jgi:exosome complex exonuclease DIS3/RRP44